VLRHLPRFLFLVFCALAAGWALFFSPDASEQRLLSPALDSLHAVVVIEAISALPEDAAALDYDHCTAVWRVRVVKQYQGRPLPEKILAAVQVIANRKLMDTALLAPGAHLEVELRTPDATPEQRISMKRIDDLMDFSLPLLHAMNAVPRSLSKNTDDEEWRAPLEAWMGEPLSNKVDLRSENSRSEREQQMRRDQNRIAERLRAAGGDWNQWEKTAQKRFTAVQRRVAKADEPFIESQGASFRRLGIQEFGRLADEGPRSEPFRVLQSLREELDQRGIDLIVVPFPSREQVQGDRFLAGGPLPADAVLNPARLRFQDSLLAAGIEVVDLVPDLRKAETDDRTSFYAHGDAHPTDQGVRISAAVLADRLLRYGFEKDGHELSMEEVRFHMPERYQKRYPRLRSSDQFTATQIRYPWGKPVLGHRKGSPVLICGDSFSRTPLLFDVEGAAISAQLAVLIGFTPASNSIHGSVAQLMKNLAREKPDFFLDPAVLVLLFQEERLLEKFYPPSDSQNRWEYAPLP